MNLESTLTIFVILLDVEDLRWTNERGTEQGFHYLEWEERRI